MDEDFAGEIIEKTVKATIKYIEDNPRILAAMCTNALMKNPEFLKQLEETKKRNLKRNNLEKFQK